MSGIKIPADLLREALRLETKGWSQQRIAEHLGVHPVSLCRRLSQIRKKELERLAAARSAIRVRQAHQLEHVADEAMQAWERSKQDAETIKVTGGVAPGGGDRTETTIKGQAGDPTFLSEFRAALAEIRKVLKIDDGSKKVNLNLGGESLATRISITNILATLSLDDLATLESATEAFIRATPGLPAPDQGGEMPEEFL